MSLSIEEKIEYHHWANMRLLDHISRLNETIFLKEVQSVFPSIAAIFEHVFQVDALWLNRIMGGKGPMFENTKLNTPQTAMDYFDQLYHHYMKLAPHANLITYQNSKGEAYQNELSDIIDHLMNHGTYHRGNVTAVLHQLGEKSVSTDLIFFLREK